MAKSLAKHPLVNYKQLPNAQLTPPTPFPQLSDKRPLAGIKIVELARIIALPATGAVLTSFGADVIRVQSKHLPDFAVGVVYPSRLARAALTFDSRHNSV